VVADRRRRWIWKTGLGSQDYSFVGEGFAGFAWSTTNVQLVVAAVSQAYEGTLVNAGKNAASMRGCITRNDGGATWHLGRITDVNGEDVQGPDSTRLRADGNAATFGGVESGAAGVRGGGAVSRVLFSRRMG
jgi:hypothetical protein